MQADTTPKNQRLSIAQLAAYDDLLTDVLVDKVCTGGTTYVHSSSQAVGVLLDHYKEKPYKV